MFCDSSVVIRSFLLQFLVTLLLSCTLPVSATQDVHWSVIGSTSSLTACDDVLFDISGGVPPFQLLALPVEGPASVHALAAHGDAWAWQINLDAGPHVEVALSIIDSQGLHADAQVLTLKGDNRACAAPKLRAREPSPRRSIGGVNSQLPLILGACIGVTVFLVLSTGMLFGIWFQRRRQRRQWNAGLIGMQPMRGSVSKPAVVLDEQSQDAYSRPFVVKNMPKLRVDLAESPPNVSTIELLHSSTDMVSPTDSVPPLPAIASPHGSSWAISPEWQHVFDHPHDTVPGITDSLFTNPFQAPPRRGSEPTTVLARDLPPPQPAHLVSRHLSIGGYDNFHSPQRHVAPMLVPPVVSPSTIRSPSILRRSESPAPVAGPSTLAPRGSIASATSTLASPSSSRLEKQRLIARDRELARQEREQQHYAEQRKWRTVLTSASQSQLSPLDPARRPSLPTLAYGDLPPPRTPAKLTIPSAVRPLPQPPQSAPAPPGTSFAHEQDSLLAAAARRGQLNALTAVHERRLRHMHSAGDIRAAVRAQQRDLAREREREPGREKRELARHLSMMPPQPRLSEESAGAASVRVPEPALGLSPPPPYSLSELVLSRKLSLPQ